MSNIGINVKPNRIAWIDIAKGICIIFVIIAHTVEIGSFHVILFFLFICLAFLFYQVILIR